MRKSIARIKKGKEKGDSGQKVSAEREVLGGGGEGGRLFSPSPSKNSTVLPIAVMILHHG